MNLIISIFFYLFIINFGNIYIGEDYICKKNLWNAYNYIRCYKEDKLFYSDKTKEDLVSFVNNKICISENNLLYIKCSNLFSEEIEYFQFYDPSLIDNYLHEIVSGNDFTCINSIHHVYCYGNESIIEQINSILTEEDITIYKLLAYEDNLCIRMSFYNNNKHEIHCIGSDETGINKVPKSFQSMKYVSQSSMKYNSMCNLTIRIDIICWGECNGLLCDIPSDIKSLVKSGNELFLYIRNGFDHGCIIKRSNIFHHEYGELLCWGSNNYGQINTPQNYSKYIQYIDAGIYSTCAIKYNNSINCWGILKDKYKFTQLDYELLSISTGGRHTCSVNIGHYSCWGNNDYGQLDMGEEIRWEVNYAISAGWDFTCATNLHNTISCIGFNFYGQTDVDVNQHHEYYDSLIQLTRSRSVKLISSGLTHSCSVLKIEYESKLSCWGGQNEYGEINIYDVVETYDGDIYINSKITTVSMGHHFTCFAYGEDSSVQPNRLKGHNRIQCIGNNDSGQLNLVSRIYYLVELSAGAAHACVIQEVVNLKIRSVYCWGSNMYGQRVNLNGQDNTDEDQFNSITTGDTNTCLILGANGVVRCYGWLVFNDVDLRGIMAKSIDTTYEYMCIVDLDLVGKCYGDDEWGQSQVPNGEDERLVI